jgi:hypothetical protein
LIVTILIVGLGLIVRITRKWTHIEVDLQKLTRDFGEYIKGADDTHREIVAMVREDRKANNERLTWLERNMYRNVTGKSHGPGM